MNEASGGLSGASNFFKLFQARVSKNSPQIGDAASKAATSTGSSSSATPSTTPLAGTNTQMPTCTDIMTTQSDISIVSGDLLVAQMLSPLADRIGKIEVDMAANPPESFPSLSSRDLELNFNYSSGKLIGVVELTTSSTDRDASTSMQRELGATKDFVRGSSSNAPFLPGGVQKASYAPSARSLLKRAQKDLSALSSIAKNPLFDFSEKKTFILPSLNMGVKFHEETDACQLIQGDQSLLSPIATQDDDENDFWGSEIKKPSPVADDGAKDAFYYRDLKRDREDDRLRRESHISGLREVVRETSSVLSQSSSSIGDAALSVSSEVSSELSSSDSLLSASDMLRLNGSSSTSTSAWLQASRSTPSSTLTSEWAITQRMANIGADFNVLVPDPAIIYPFEMDDFQKEAAYHLEQGESVFIAAHTSAGKTVVAEYAIALAMKHSTRAIYTSPIKALSNQKYRDFKDTFGDDVGLITGDVSVHPEASCLIVTTEILRSMLYKGADLVRDVEWVIFDEVHYINDLERGVVWEEVIIMLPAHVGLIFLSATVPNTFEFADWVGRTKRKKVFVISTNKRPVPLEHYLYHDKNIYKISDSKDGFLIGGFSTVTNLIRTRQEKRDEGRAKKAGAAAPPPRRFTRSSNGVSPGTWSNIVTMLRAKDLLPAVCFVFSKKKCLELAKSLLHIDLTNRDEKNEVRRFIAESMKRLKGTDKDLPQVQVMSELLSRGIGVHHGGLLPIVKEIVEILFSVSLIKVLFATETFAMGVNMPTRTVVFDSLSKYDGGKGRRPLLPGEYIQMSGRAGRRGLDTVGTVIVATQEELPDSASLRTVLTGRATRLSSQFRLTYNMILNLLKMGGDFRIEDMIKRSFFESSNQKDNTKLKDKLQLSKSLLAQTERVKCEKDIEDVPMTTYYSLVAQEMTLQRRIQQWLAKSSYCSEYLCPGRVLIVNIQGFPKQSYAVVVRAPGTISGNKNTQEASNEAKLTTMRILVLTGSAGRALTDKYKVLVVDAASSEIELVTMKRVKNLEPERIDIVPDEYHLNQVLKDLDDFRIEALPGFPPVLDPIKGLKIKDMDFIDMNAKLREVREIYATSPCHKCEFKEKHFALEERYVKLKTQVEAIEYLLSDDNLLMIPEYEARLGVLKRLDYVNIDGVVQLKGRVARELNNCDELIATELIFMNSFSSMPPDEICALLSCFVCEGRSDGDPVVPPALKASQQLLIQLATRLGELQVDMGVPITPQEFVDENVQVGLMEVVYEWAHNRPFQEIMRLTDYQEGSIVRTIVRLDETLRDFRSAAILMGNVDLAHKMEEASHLIKRDIVFASSLYIAEDQQKQQKQKLGYDGSALADEQDFDVDPENVEGDIEGDIEDEAGIVDFEDGGIVEF